MSTFCLKHVEPQFSLMISSRSHSHQVHAYLKLKASECLLLSPSDPWFPKWLSISPDLENLPPLSLFLSAVTGTKPFTKPTAKATLVSLNSSQQSAFTRGIVPSAPPVQQQNSETFQEKLKAKKKKQNKTPQWIHRTVCSDQFTSTPTSKHMRVSGPLFGAVSRSHRGHAELPEANHITQNLQLEFGKMRLYSSTQSQMKLSIRRK